MKRKFLLSAAIVAMLGIGVPTLKSTPTGAPSDGRTGSPGDGGKTCVDGGCHSGSVSVVSGIITSNIPTEGYTPGTSYTITVTVDGSGKKGFCVSPQKSDGTVLGTLSGGSGNSVVGKGYVTHTNFKSTSPAVWTFTWVAPVAGTGTVDFYGAYANNTSMVRRSVVSFNEKIASGIAEEKMFSDVRIFPNPVSEKQVSLSFNQKQSGKVSLTVLDISGKVVLETIENAFVSGMNQKILDLTGLNNGIYFLQIQGETEQSIQKFLIQ